ncbi:MAG TPA: glycosyltransferase family 2 protein [Mycobacteriales bacterium]|nr:glycosyltransferase family 2 protein [Mycobacteriales bacterium]
MRTLAVLKALSWAGTTAVAARGVTGTWNVVSSLTWLHGGEPGNRPAPVSAGSRPAERRPYFVLVLPMLREQTLIADAVSRFAELAGTWADSSLVVVTTERERAERGRTEQRAPGLAQALTDRASPRRIMGRFLGVLPRQGLERLAATAAGQPYEQCLAAVRAALGDVRDTDVLAGELVAKARAEGVDAWHYHCPQPDAAMVHQVNHAARAEIDRLTAGGVDPGRIWVVIYNADSQPDPAILPTAAGTITRLAADPGPAPRILQQSALFTANLRRMHSGPAGIVLTGAALLQSRWTLAREIPRLRRQANQARTRPNRAGRWPWLAHCVGHGLFINADLFTDTGGLPTASMNEDLATGYLACAAGIPIDPVPLLEWADSPETVTGMVRQARQWFWSYTEYPRFADMAARANLGRSGQRVWLSAQGVARGALWLGQSPATAAVLALPALAGRRGLAAAVSVLTAYYVAPFILIARESRRHGYPVHIGGRELAGGLAACLTGSAGPWWCLVSAARHALTGAHYSHDRTAR